MTASVTVLDVYPWPEPFTHPEALTLLKELVGGAWRQPRHPTVSY